jgi:hypothetical protein
MSTTINNGTKLDSGKSRFQPRGPKPSTADFEKEVGKAIEDSDELKKQARELSDRFMAMMKDKTLPDNKGLIGRDLEIETILNISKFALALNSDEMQPEGIGAIGVCQILMNAVLNLRDQVNELSYEIYNLKKQLQEKPSS